MVRFSRGLSKMTLLNRYDIIDTIYSIDTSVCLSDSISNKGLRCQDEFILIFALAGFTTRHQRLSFSLYFIYSESQINEYIARAHKMSSSKFILKSMTAVMLPHWSTQKESCLDVRSFKGLNTIYENISKYHCS